MEEGHRIKHPIRVIGIAALLVGGMLIPIVLRSQPEKADLASPLAGELRTRLFRLSQVENELVCIPGSDPAGLADLLIDSSDYLPSWRDLENVHRFFGLEGITHPGYLTSRQAYFLSRRFPVPNTPPPGVRPTQPPSLYCPETGSQPQISLQAVLIYSDQHVTVQFKTGVGLYEAAFRFAGDRWFISGVKLIQWYGI